MTSSFSVSRRGVSQETLAGVGSLLANGRVVPDRLRSRRSRRRSLVRLLKKSYPSSGDLQGFGSTPRGFGNDNLHGSKGGIILTSQPPVVDSIPEFYPKDSNVRVINLLPNHKPLFRSRLNISPNSEEGAWDRITSPWVFTAPTIHYPPLIPDGGEQWKPSRVGGSAWRVTLTSLSRSKTQGRPRV